MDQQAYEQSMQYIENFYSKCGMHPASARESEVEKVIEEDEEQFAICHLNGGSSIMFMDGDDLIYSGIEKKRNNSKDMHSA